MKRIMILGGNIVQAEATKTAKRLGYYTISTDLHEKNPGHSIADEYCKVDIMDREAVLREARRLKIDGIIPYTSDVLAPIAAYVAEEMGLPGNPYSTVYTMTHKDEFRAFLKTHGFRTPAARGFDNIDEAIAYFECLGKDAMMKPVDSASSKGVFHIRHADDIRTHWAQTTNNSILGRVIIEEFIERKGMQQDGDIFVKDGRIVFWSFSDQHKDPIAPYMPAMLTFPTTIDSTYEADALKQIEAIIQALGFKNGPCNVEYMVSTNGEVFIMEIGPRNGGNLIPFAIKDTTGVDLTEITIKTAVADEVVIPQWHYNGYAATVLLHSRESGIFKGIEVPERYLPALRNTFMYRHPGDKVERFASGSDTIGSMNFYFSEKTELPWFEPMIEKLTDFNIIVNECR